MKRWRKDFRLVAWGGGGGGNKQPGKSGGRTRTRVVEVALPAPPAAASRRSMQGRVAKRRVAPDEERTLGGEEAGRSGSGQANGPKKN